MSELPKINVVTVGHKDHGKSTLIGRLLYESKTLKKEELIELKQTTKELGKKNIEFAFLIDRFKEEREGGLTIDIMHIPFKTKKYDYTIIDCPGHEEFIKNMITGASKADAAILVVSAKPEEGVMEQTKEHVFLIKTLGINQMVVAISKMDTVNYSKKRFDELSEKVKKFLKSIGYNIQRIPFVPISALKGSNIFTKSNEMRWYTGLSFVQTLDETFRPVESSINKPLRISVQDIYTIDGRKFIIGKVESGILRVGDEVVFQPSNTIGRIKNIQKYNEKKKEASPGESIGFEIEKLRGRDVKRGDVCGHLTNSPTVARKFSAHVILLYPLQIKVGDIFLIHRGSAEVNCKVEKIDNLNGKFASRVKKVKFSPLQKIVVERYNDNQQLGRFVIRDKGTIIGAGIVLDVK
jgi:elongation factor 1-alpha